mmetsp:Transcript_89505/g.239347  ORF Transcript_89505/g.239347 Transcript_89505/m.239347 type:complete len:158 (+) Transcript_89505:204-677(+)
MIAGGRGKITKEQVSDVLFEAMGRVRAEEESEKEFLECFERGEVDPEYFEDIIESYKARYPSTKPSKQYISASKLRDDRVKHRRCDGSSSDKFVAPVTSSQEYGWGDAGENLVKATRPCGKMFAHRPSFMSYYAESMVCFEEGRDFCAGPTMKAMEL